MHPPKDSNHLATPENMSVAGSPKAVDRNGTDSRRTSGSTYLRIPTADYFGNQIANKLRRDGIEFDFNPLDYNTFYDGMDLTGIYSLVSSSAFLALTGTPSSGSTGAQNHGKLYPPLGDTGNAF